jgi:RimJ/RimL family protein N-acetyltransferase
MVTPPADELETARLHLESLRADHATEMVAVLADPSLYEFTGGTPPSLDELRWRYGSQVDGSGDPNELWYNWILRTKADGTAVGFVQATVAVDPGPMADVAWLLGVGHQGRGFAVEGAKSMVEWLASTGVRSFTAHIHPAHARSQEVARAIGFVETSEVDDDGEVVWASD